MERVLSTEEAKILVMEADFEERLKNNSLRRLLDRQQVTSQPEQVSSVRSQVK